MRKTKMTVLHVLVTMSVFASSPLLGQVAQSSSFFDVVKYGAVGDGKTLCTTAIQKAVDTCAAAGGGTVRFPAGRYLSGAIFLKSNVTLHIGEGATLLASTNFDDFPPFKPGWRILSDDTTRSSLVTGLDLENIAITGRGTLNGQGKLQGRPKEDTHLWTAKSY
jgi:polygalacturonase